MQTTYHSSLHKIAFKKLINYHAVIAAIRQQLVVRYNKYLAITSNLLAYFSQSSTEPAPVSLV
jgi:hypothetical protein